MKNVLLTFTLIFCFSQSGLPQSELAFPKIRNFTNKTYQGGLQNWGATQDANGAIYFGNNEGLLIFNGSNWDRYQLPNQTIIRSLQFDSRKRLFVGGQDEIGYFQPMANGELQFYSLKSRIPEKDRNFADIWKVVRHQDEFFFLEHNRIYHFKDEVVQAYTSDTEWLFLGEVNGRVIAQDKAKGLMEFSNGVWKNIHQQAQPEPFPIVSILPHGEDSLLVTTISQGMYLLSAGEWQPFPTEIDATLRDSWVNSVTQLDEGSYAIGTKSSGVLIMDKAGNLIQQFTYSYGLQTNNVRNVFVDRDMGLWIGLDDGIDYIDFQNPIKEIQPDSRKRVSGYSAINFQNELYLGTTDGLYKFSVSSANEDMSLSKGNFSLVKSTLGQVWKIQEINHRLLMGHENGAFEISKDEAKPIFTSTGVWVSSLPRPSIPVQKSS